MNHKYLIYKYYLVVLTGHPPYSIITYTYFNRYIIADGERNLVLPTVVYHRTVEQLRNTPEFTLTATMRQEPGNSGTILSFSSESNR